MVTKEAGDSELLRAANDPTTPQANLADLAYDHPDLRAAIAANPSTYQGLLDWLRELDDPAVNAVLDARANTASTVDEKTVAARTTSKSQRAEVVATPEVALEAAATPAASTIATGRIAPAAGKEPQTCSTCGTSLKTDANFCGSCGTRIPGRAGYDAGVRPAARLNRRWVSSVLGAAALILLMVTGLGIAQAVASANQGQALSSSSANDASGTDNADGTSNNSSGTDASGGSSGSQANATSSSAATAAPVELYDFRSNSGNITCEMTAESVVCHQATIQYAMPAEACQTGIAGVAVGVDANGAEWPCLESTIPASTILPYDQPVTQWGFTCTIDYSIGVQCTNSNGDGFTMNYASGVTTF